MKNVVCYAVGRGIEVKMRKCIKLLENETSIDLSCMPIILYESKLTSLSYFRSQFNLTLRNGVSMNTFINGEN